MNLYINNGDIERSCFVDKVSTFPNGIVKLQADANSIGYLILALQNTVYSIDVEDINIILTIKDCSIEVTNGAMALIVDRILNTTDEDGILQVRETVARQREAEAEEQRVKASKLNAVRPEPELSKAKPKYSCGAVVD